MIDEKPSTFCQTKIKNKKLRILDGSKDCVPIGLYKENLELETEYSSFRKYSRLRNINVKHYLSGI